MVPCLDLSGIRSTIAEGRLLLVYNSTTKPPWLDKQFLFALKFHWDKCSYIGILIFSLVLSPSIYLKYMLTLVSRRFPVLGYISFCVRTLPNRFNYSHTSVLLLPRGQLSGSPSLQVLHLGSGPPALRLVLAPLAVIFLNNCLYINNAHGLQSQHKYCSMNIYLI